MKAGKISEAQCKRSVLKLLPEDSDRVLQGAGIGNDYAMLQMGGSQRLATAMATCTLNTGHPARYAFSRACNKLATGGSRPLAIMAGIWLPARGNEDRIKDVIKELAALCTEAGIDYIGGHTELLEELRTPIIAVTVYGESLHTEPTDAAQKVQAGESLVMLGYAGLEATAMLLQDRWEELHSRYAESYLYAAKTLTARLDLWKELIKLSPQMITYIHDCSTGGVFAALWEIGEAAGCGIEVGIRQIPIRQETIEVCEYFDVNPYMALSGGSAIVVTKEPEPVIRQMAELGLNAAVIGHTTGMNDRIITNEDDNRYLTPPKGDDIYKIYRN